MIDFHNHVLPNVDDGASSLEISLDMLRYAESQGITDVVNTVHYQHPKVEGKNISFDKINYQLEKLQRSLISNNIKIKLHCASEVFFMPNLLKIKEDPLASFIHGKYMLIEFQSHYIPDISEKQLFDLKMADVTPIIAHPERYRQVQDDLNFIEKWLNSGCLIQIDAGSILGKFGPKVKKCSEIITENLWCHIIGSDAHNNKSRTFCLGEAVKLLNGRLGSENVKKMVYDNPRAVIDGKPIIIDFEYDNQETGFFSKIKNKLKNYK